ncbi:MAG: hypothetical protein AABY22_21685 [Nanoarchaeota archaeon]
MKKNKPFNFREEIKKTRELVKKIFRKAKGYNSWSNQKKYEKE